MSDEFDALKQDYKAIRAPEYVATRIRADVADRPTRGHRWMPASATAIVAVAAVWLLPMLWQQQALQQPPARPSLSALASLKPDKPAVRAPSLSQVRSVPTPRMPKKPSLRKKQPQTKFDIDSDVFKEKDHAHT